jgi:lysophospholipase L1-like esterase
MRIFVLGMAVLMTMDATQGQQAAPCVPDAHTLMLKNDFGQLARYGAADVALGAPKPGERRVIFYGDSITDGWHLDQYFPGRGYINRGIGGQTTAQMLVRFRQDVIDLAPRVVVVLAGTNDIAGNTGPVTVEQVEENISTMAELARVHGIRMVFSSVTPVYGRMVDGRPPEKILAMNTWMKQYAAANSSVYLDYFTAMVDGTGHMKQDLADDGLHPNAAGYRVMAPLAHAAVAQALGR